MKAEEKNIYTAITITKWIGEMSHDSPYENLHWNCDESLRIIYIGKLIGHFFFFSFINLNQWTYETVSVDKFDGRLISIIVTLMISYRYCSLILCVHNFMANNQ